MLGEYSDGKHLKRKLEDIHEQIFKYFAEIILVETVWQRIVMKFERKSNVQWMESLLEQIYQEDASMKFTFNPSGIVAL